MSDRLAAGWVWDQYKGALLRFEHMAHRQADLLERQSAMFWVVETINSTLPVSGGAVRHNLYFAVCLTGAISLAARIEIEAQDVAERVVNIRQASAAEVTLFGPVYDHYAQQEPVALSEAEAAQLAGGQQS